MKKMLIYSFLLFCSGMMANCDGDTYTMHDKAAPNATITTDVQSINVPGEGGTYTIQVSTTGKEWNAYTNDKWLTVSSSNTNSSSGTVTVTVPENGVARVLRSEVIIMSGTARKSIPLYAKAQQAGEELVRRIQENMSGVRIIKALSRTEDEKDRFSKANEAAVRADRQAEMTMAVANPMMGVLLNIAMAAVIFGKWTPFGAYGACLLFGFTQALVIMLGGGDFVVPSQILSMLPYAMTIIVLILFVGRSVAPKADGVPYIKGSR